MATSDQDNLKALHAWNANARFWDERMGEGNDFFNVLVWPAVERLLRPRPGARLLDIACGNGLTSRRLAGLGASVVAVDFSEELIALARERRHGREIDYRVIDVTDRNALVGLGEAAFEGALCNMALMDIAEVQALMTALASLLRPGGPFVFAPCGNCGAGRGSAAILVQGGRVVPARQSPAEQAHPAGGGKP